MSESFDPYHGWLGIPPSEQPPDHYRLLGIARFENNADVISAAADRQMAFVRGFQSGKRGPYTQPLLNELSAARCCLLGHDSKAAYDAELRAKWAQSKVAEPPMPSMDAPPTTTPPTTTTASPLPAMLPLPDPSGRVNEPTMGAMPAQKTHAQETALPKFSPTTPATSTPTPLPSPSTSGPATTTDAAMPIASPGLPSQEGSHREHEKKIAEVTGSRLQTSSVPLVGPPPPTVPTPPLSAPPVDESTQGTKDAPPPAVEPQRTVSPQAPFVDPSREGTSTKQDANQQTKNPGKEKRPWWASPGFLSIAIAFAVGLVLLTGILLYHAATPTPPNKTPNPKEPSGKTPGKNNGSSTTTLRRDPRAITANSDGSYTLLAPKATIRRGSAAIEHAGNLQVLAFRERNRGGVAWRFYLPRSGSFRIEALYATPGASGGRIHVEVSNSKASYHPRIASTEDIDEFETMQIGYLHLRKGGNYTLRLQVIELQGEPLFLLRSIRLVPMKSLAN